MENYFSKNIGFENAENNNKTIVNYKKIIDIVCLMADFAHEISNPLAFVISNLDTLTNYISKYKGIIREINHISKNRNKKEKNLLVNLYCLGKIEDNKLDFIYNDIDNLLTETKEGIERIKNTVDSIKNFARLNNKENFRKIDLNTCINRALLLSKNEIKNVACVEKEFTSSLAIEGDFDQLVQALLNLILNVQAIKTTIG